MISGQIVDSRSTDVLIPRVSRTTRSRERLLGLLGRDSLASGEGLLIDPCGSVHTLFMRFSLDLVYLSREFIVLKLVRNVRPWRFSGRLGARYTLELQAGEIARLKLSKGQALKWQDID